MTTWNYRLPEIELPTEKTLDDENDEVFAAFRVMWNGYKRAQKRTREILKAYKDLESITKNILKEHHEDPEKSSKNDPGNSLVDKNDPEKLLVDKNDPGISHIDQNLPGKSFVNKNDPGKSLGDKNDHGKSLTDKNVPGKLLIDKNTLKNNSSTPKVVSCEQKKTNMEQKEVEMVDLTALFDCDRAEKAAGSRWREISPELGERRQRSSKKLIAASLQNGAWHKVEEQIEKTALKNKRVVNKHKSTSENQGIAGNEENRPPFCDSSLNSSSNNNSMLCTNESQPISKIGFTKTIYNIERSKTPNGKPSKQSKLIFQPVVTKINVSSSDKIITKSDIFGHYGGNLFDPGYRTKKKIKDGENSGQLKEQNNVTIVKDSTETESIKEAAGIDKIESDEQSRIKMQTSLMIPTASQIDETARSLFDDEDIDDFGVSHDLLNICVRSPVLADVAQEIASKDNIERNKVPDAITSTSNASQFVQSRHSIDETFFAPAELMKSKSEAKEKIVTDISETDCSTIAKTNIVRESNRVLKRKSGEEVIVDAEKELGDLGLQDINWDAEISNDDWTSSNRPIHNSFDIPPEKKKNSPQYAHKGKVERNKAKRSKLRGWDCWQCENYYGKLDLPAEELRKRMDACSRHRSKYNQRYYTPAGFWNPEFPETTDSSDSS